MLDMLVERALEGGVRREKKGRKGRERREGGRRGRREGGGGEGEGEKVTGRRELVEGARGWEF